MRFDGRLVGFGVFFIVFGSVVLAVRQGWITTDVAQRAWQLWPVLLIGAGLSIVLARRPGAPLGRLIVAVGLGAMAGGLVAGGGSFPFVSCGGGSSAAAFAGRSGELGPEASVDLTFNCGDLVVATAPGSTWSISGSSEDGRIPRVAATDDSLSIEPAERSGLFGFGGRETWAVNLPTEPSIDLDLTLNAGLGELTLSAARLGNVGFTLNAGSLQLDLAAAERLDKLDGTVNAGSAVIRLPKRTAEGDIKVNAGSLTFCAPEGVGLRFVTGDNFLSANNFGERGLVRVGEAWESPNFATAELRIELDVQANAGSLSLDSPQACAG
ncbi:MAG TPA: DUF5668 domain-containing protein [Candidatus Limnocylindrales bacterium]|jgi:hypothetical protein|nr:DUF5668 domain-containing protein [Candidatus Limnocylindrales bacterium]